ncbi:nucleoside triphosphate pyrophosphohydrolase family protein [Priestia flexa]
MMNTSHLVGEITEMMTKGQGEMKVFGLNQYQELASRTDNDKEPLNMRLANYALGLVSEGGEVGDIIKKHVFHGHDLDKDEIKKELGDVIWYLAMVAKLCDVTLEELATANISKLSKRYKNGFSKEASIKRVDTK